MTVPVKPKFALGDVVAETSQVSGDKPSTVHWKIVGVFKNLDGWWFVGEAMTGIHVGSQDTIGDGSTLKKVATTKKPADVTLLLDAAFSHALSQVKKFSSGG